MLEGERSEVKRIYAKIARDPRHEDLKIIGQRQIEQRAFANWAMGGFTRSPEVEHIYESLGLSDSESLKAAELDTILALALELSVFEIDRKQHRTIDIMSGYEG